MTTEYYFLYYKKKRKRVVKNPIFQKRVYIWENLDYLV